MKKSGKSLDIQSLLLYAVVVDNDERQGGPMKRRGGRPRAEMAAMDAALRGQLRSVVMGMDAQRLPWREMAERLQALTGVRVHPDTIRNWTRAYREEVTSA